MVVGKPFQKWQKKLVCVRRKMVIGKHVESGRRNLSVAEEWCQKWHRIVVCVHRMVAGEDVEHGRQNLSESVE
jgi:hypothetical protein